MGHVMSEMNKSWVLAAIAVGLGSTAVRAQSVRFGVAPTEDTFVREALPDATFGQSDLLNVSGAEARNGLGAMQGVHETCMKFDLSEAVAQFDAQFGAGDWEIDSIAIDVVEVGQPESALFNRGAGSFNVNWVSDDEWAEGTGQPSDVGIVSGNDLSFNAAQQRLADAQMQNLGRITSMGLNGTVADELVLRDLFFADVKAGNLVTIYLTPADPDIGFSFYSSERGEVEPDDMPLLTVTARSTSSEPSGPSGNDNQNSNSPDPMPTDPGNGAAEPPPPPMCGMAMIMPMTLMLSVLGLMRWVRPNH